MEFLFLFGPLLTILTQCQCFNLETRLPVIKRGREGSYFGFSVAEHQSFDDVKGEIEQSWLLVGAPLDQNKQPETNRSGALWSCPITTLTTDCQQVTTDGKRTIDDKKLMPPLSDEVKDGQWLGVTVRSQGVGGKVMVCAHRYIKSGEDYRYGGGLCYTLTQRLDYDESWEPCKGRPTARAHEQYGFCQAGTSGLIINDTAVMGSPGLYTWRGAVFVISVSNDYLYRDQTMYYSPHTEDKPPVDHHSYLGMSVAAGQWFGEELFYAAGAPRSNGTGQVVIFGKQRQPTTSMETIRIIDGEQFTSNFGYEMTTADVNGDRLPDLLVGAPNYFSKDAGGAVYIYLNKDHCLDCAPPLKLTGKPESRFGIAIANMSDLNKDGYEDIAIGAPYEGDGVVYIFLGSAKGLITEPSQIIKGKEFGKMVTFGYSLSGGLDIDGNGYPDLLVGAFESSSVVLLRARPIVDLTTTVRPPQALSNIDPNTKGCLHHRLANLTCFSFEACVSVKSVGEGRLGTQMKLRYTLEADVNRRVPRVSFDQLGSRHQMVQRNVTLVRDSLTNEFNHCHLHTAYIKDGTRDIQSAIAMRLAYELIQEEPVRTRPGQPLPSIDDLPILNQQQAAKLFEATFLKDCGDNDVCESQLEVDAQLSLPLRSDREWELVLGEHTEIKLNASVHNFKESAYEAQLVIYHPPSLQYIGYVKQIDAGHSCEVVNSSMVMCSIGNPLERDASARIMVRFDPSGLDDTGPDLRLIVLANSTSLLVDRQGPVSLRATIVNKADLRLTGQGKPERMIYGGHVKGESAMKYKDDIGSKVLHMYQVVNSGPWRVRNLQVEVEWPHQVANNKVLGKWLLYLDEKPYVEGLGGGECTVNPPELVNPLGLISRGSGSATSRHDESLKRSRRDIEVIVKTTNYTDPLTGKIIPIVSLNCDMDTAKCFKFRCTIYSLEENQEATIFIKSRLWNVTLVEDYSHVSQVRISSKARIVLPPSVNIQQNTIDDVATVRLVALRGGHGETTAEDLPLWILILAIVIGLLILLLLALLLSKCGFFRRRRPHDPTLSADAILDKSKPDDYDY